ncbi:hypothetical protein Lal_00049515 [Lupinus albus]|nr:hypothetical protein Lal_00049515 [Lupinus albus]
MTSEEGDGWPIELLRNSNSSCGFSIRRGHTYKHSKNNVDDIYKREYIFHHDGIANQQKVVELERQRRWKSSKCKCSAKLIITKRTIGFEECWVITYFSNSHNHTLLDNKEVRFLPAYRDIPINDQGRILLLSKAGCSVSIIMRVFELEKGIEAGLLPFLEKDIRNFLQSHSNVGKYNDDSEVLKLCKSLKDKDDALLMYVVVNEHSQITYFTISGMATGAGMIYHSCLIIIDYSDSA